MKNTPLIFDIKRYAINDGPGIRITIFMKGCPLSCKWCHNPESQSKQQQRMYTNTKCIGCGECIKVCPTQAITLHNGEITTDASLCNLCGKCSEVCPTKAIEMTGELLTIEQVMTQIKKEILLIDQSEGGVTFSGGEPLMHHEFLLPILDACAHEEIHCCIDTSGYAKTEILMEVAQKADHFLYDLKMMDSEKHKKWTGVPNELILHNLETLASTGIDLNIRIPLIKGVNDDDWNVHESARFIANLKGKKPVINLLPFHNIAENKYGKLGVCYDKGDMDAPSLERQQEILEIFKSYNIETIIGG